MIATLWKTPNIYFGFPVASFQWDCYLLSFWGCLDGTITWSHILLLSSLQLLLSNIKIFGARAVLTVFNTIRWCDFRSLWLHRNKRLYNPETSTNALFVRHHCFAYVDLHLRKLKADAERRRWQGMLHFRLEILPALSLTLPDPC